MSPLGTLGPKRDQEEREEEEGRENSMHTAETTPAESQANA